MIYQRLSLHLSKLSNLSKLSRKLTSTRLFSTSKINLERKYTKNEDWLDYKKNFIEVGLTHKARQQLGDLVFIEFQYDEGELVEKDDDLVVVESVKATDSIKAPFDCKIIENNTTLEDDLDILNNDADNTWIIKISKSNN